MAELQTNLTTDSALLNAFDQWLEAEIRRLSIETLKAHTITCTACGEVAGDYIIDYQGSIYRFPAAKAYAFLQFVAASAG